MLNEFDAMTGFYKLHNIEAEITALAESNTNAYLVCIFATNRTAYDTKRHAGLLSKEQADTKRLEWIKLVDERY